MFVLVKQTLNKTKTADSKPLRSLPRPKALCVT